MKNETVQFSCTVVLNRRRNGDYSFGFKKTIHTKLVSHFLLIRMAVGRRFLFTAIVVLIICSGDDAYPADDDFFFNDQLSIAGRLRSVVDKKLKSSNEETILNDMPNDEGSGNSGDAEPSDGDIGSGIGEDLSTTTKSHKKDRGSGDGEPDDEDNGSGFSSGSADDLSTTTELKTNDKISTTSSSSWSDDEIVSTFKSSSSGDDLLSTTTKSHTNDKGSGDGEPDDEDNGSGFSSGSADDLSTTTELQTNDKISTISSSSSWPVEEIVSQFTSGSSGNDFSTESHTVTREVSIIDLTEKTDEKQTTELSPTTLPTTRQPPLELVSIEV